MSDRTATIEWLRARLDETIALYRDALAGREAKLPDRPDRWGTVDSIGEGKFRQRWRPGAFGRRKTLAGVRTFKVVQDEWHEDADGEVWRTVLNAEVLEEERS